MSRLLDQLDRHHREPSRSTARRTQSLCPECLTVVPADLVVEEDRLVMRKRCPEHGPFQDLISSDAEFFFRLERLADKQAGCDATTIADVDGCPRSCGLCDRHLSRTMMLNIDLTNRCNLRCPICFANADARGYLYQVTREQVQGIIERVVRSSRVPPACVQFSGGEPTLHPDFIDILADARRHQFAQVQVATNGLRFAREPDFARACAEAGLNIVYLQFDGLSDEVYVRTRGVRLLELKLRAIDNVHAAGMTAALVPTIVNGLNDDQVGPILKYAVANVDKVTAISWQPVSFTGRIDDQQRAAQRFTLADLARCLDEQTGWVSRDDWYPYSFVEPFCKLLEVITGQPSQHTTCHGHCGMATYLIINPATQEVVPIPQMVDVEPLMEQLGRVARRLERWPWLNNRWHTSLIIRKLRQYHHDVLAPSGWNFDAFIGFMLSFMDFGAECPDNTARRAWNERAPWRALLLAAMHFQDAYNFELDRIRRCVVHYGTPDGRLYPFCTYNCGPFFRDRVEHQFARRDWQRADHLDIVLDPVAIGQPLDPQYSG